jgi:pimeloyl-ACP methyl ester carboxylesterase
VGALADALGVGPFSVLGISGGAPYALACLARWPGRVRRATLVSGLGPIREPRLLGSMSLYAQRALMAARHFPFLVRWVLAARRPAFERSPEAFLGALVQRWPRPDQELIGRPLVREMFLADLREVLLNGQGPEGMAQELHLYFRWGFRLSDLADGRRVVLWHGTGDRLVPALMAHELARRLAGAELLLRPGGHFMVVDQVEEVFARAGEPISSRNGLLS